jgi:lysozyme
MLNGIDVSHWQEFDPGYYENFNHQQLAFVMIKASDGIYTDKRLVTHTAGFAKTCLLKGYYHYLRFKSKAQEQIDSFVRALDKVGGFTSTDLPPALDVEDEDEDISPQQSTDLVHAWLEGVKSKLGVEPMIYTGKWYWDNPKHMANSTAFSGYKLWSSRYASSYLPNYGGWTQPTMWQYTETGRLPKYNGDVDLNKFFGGIDDLWALTKDKKLIIAETEVVDKIFGVQTVLQQLNYYSGRVDGKCGKNTRAALNAWCTAKQLPKITDIITPAHWNALFSLDPTLKAGSAPIEKPAASPGTNVFHGPGVVAANLLNIREKPEAGANKVALPLTRGTAIDIVDDKDGWLNVKVEIQGWVSKTFVKQ